MTFTGWVARTRAEVTPVRYPVAVALLSALFGVGPCRAAAQAAGKEAWNPAAAAAYLDARLEWWQSWPNAGRDHETVCVSCHTALPYALARPALRRVLAERARPAAEERMQGDVAKRVALWREVEPFYPDQTRGLPKTSESRGTEAVLNALVLAVRDADSGAPTPAGRDALAKMWALQMRTGPLEGAWPWLDFGLEPWEAPASPYFGASLAAIAVGTAPGYAAETGIERNLELLRRYLRRGADSESLFNRLMALWASGAWPGLLEESQRAGIVSDAEAAQGADGGWRTASLAPWRHLDGTPLEATGDGFATALAVLALQEAGVPPAAESIRRGRAWLVAHQDTGSGAWPAASVNKARDAGSDAGRFMSDAATAYAALALARGG